MNGNKNVKSEDSDVLLKMKNIVFSKDGENDGHLFTRAAENIIFLFAITVVALLLRESFFKFESLDYKNFLSNWYERIKSLDGIHRLGVTGTDYMPTYIYLMTILSYIPISSLAGIKIISCIADIILAFYTMRLVGTVTGKNSLGLVAYAVVLFTPTVVLNSACWGQCDAIYTAALVACVYYLIKGKDTAALLALSIAFAFKLQAIFLLPLVAVMIVKKKVRWGTLLLIPAVYLTAIIPAMLGGRSFSELMSIYLVQGTEYNHRLSLNAPNLCALVSNEYAEVFSKGFVLLALGIVLMSLAFIYRKRFELTPKVILSIAFFYSLLLPFILPHMHERYFYPAEILGIIVAFAYPKKFFIPVILVYCSLRTYLAFLVGTSADLNLLALLMSAMLIFTVLHLVKVLNENPPAAVVASSAAPEAADTSASALR